VPRPASAKTQALLIETSTRSAELIKHASNAFLALKISFINAVANMCEALGADITEVSKGIGSDNRIGPGFLRPGIGYGGSCFPKDLAAFQVVARECGYEFPLLAEVVNINERQKAQFLRKLRKALWTLRGKKLGVLGLAFKGGTDDIRESPAIAVIQSLLAEGCKIKAYDPAAMANARRVLQKPDICFVDSAYEAARGSDALLVLTDWSEFAELDLDRIKMEMIYPIVVDGRNLYDPATMQKIGFAYYSIGRRDVEQNRMQSEAAAQGRVAASLTSG
jgi:UDPglucose 6-dehydrogenase